MVRYCSPGVWEGSHVAAAGTVVALDGAAPDMVHLEEEKKKKKLRMRNLNGFVALKRIIRRRRRAGAAAGGPGGSHRVNIKSTLIYEIAKCLRLTVSMGEELNARKEEEEVKDDEEEQIEKRRPGNVIQLNRAADAGYYGPDGSMRKNGLIRTSSSEKLKERERSSVK